MTANTLRRPKLALATLGCLLCTGLAASPARAGNEFQNAFEDQMGRLVAIEAFQVGRFILSGGYAPYHSYGYRVYTPPPRPTRHRHHQWKHRHHGRGHGHHKHHAAGPCEIDRRPHRSRGDYVEEERVYRRRVHRDRDAQHASW